LWCGIKDEMIFDLTDELGVSIFDMVLSNIESYDIKHILAMTNKTVRNKIYTENRLLYEVMEYNCNPYHNNSRPIKDILKHATYEEIMTILHEYSDEMYIDCVGGAESVYLYSCNKFIEMMLEIMFDKDWLYLLGNMYDIDWNGILYTTRYYTDDEEEDEGG
jgi:hypothetical protein